MDFFFHPKGVAVIGAGPNPEKGGYQILNNIKKGFTGPCYPVNPRYAEIEGITCYASVLDVPDPVETAVIFVPALLVADIVSDCAKRGLKGVIIESGGFAETGNNRLQDALKDIREKTGIRIWGPNCMGIVDTLNRHVFSFVSEGIWKAGLLKGDASLVVQSGMLSGAYLIDIMTEGVMGINKVCSIGNKADVDETELLEYLLDDDSTKVIGLYLESINNGRKFYEILKTAKKPVVLLKGGKSEKGAKAAVSHTASMAGNHGVIKGAAAQAGVIVAEGFNEMMDILRALSCYPDIPQKDKAPSVAIVTYSGGAGIVTSDYLASTDLIQADFSPKTSDAVKTVFPEWMPVANPIDIWPAVEKNGAVKAYRVAVEALCEDPAVDAIFLHVFTGGFGLYPDMTKLVSIAASHEKPLFAWLTGEREAVRSIRLNALELKLPVYKSIQRAVKCMEAVMAGPHLKKKETGKKREVRTTVSLDTVQLPETTGLILNEFDAKKVLSDAGFPTVSEVMTRNKKKALEAAEKMGFPIVLKGIIGDMVHKTEKGLVHLNLTDRDMFAGALNALSAEGVSNYLVQKQVDGKIELIMGMIRDPQFGVSVMVGLGGIYAEVLNRREFGLHPLDEKDAFDMIERLGVSKLFSGYRGLPKTDGRELAKMLIILGEMGNKFENIREIDVNPVIIDHTGKPVAVDAVMVLEKGR